MTTKTRRALVLPPKDPNIEPKFVPKMYPLIGQVIEVKWLAGPQWWQGANWSWHPDWLRFLDEKEDPPL